MRGYQRIIAAVFTLAVLLTALPVSARAYTEMAVGDDCIGLIQKYEGFSASAYSEGGRWYIGYGSLIAEGASPDGVTEDDAVALLREELSGIERALNRFFFRNGIEPTQAQFDALADFTYTYNESWLSGSSALLRIVRGDTEATRRETARAFGVWSHAGGSVLPGLAARRLEEAALWLDGDLSHADEFCYLGVSIGEGVSYSTDFAVYERGGAYDAFPGMFRLGYTLTGLKTAKGKTIHVGDTVAESLLVDPIWERSTYQTGYNDVNPENWYYDYVMDLSDHGVINGVGKGAYAPAQSTTTGEALKLILLAAGHAAQDATGDHWASGYVDYVKENHLLPASLLGDPDQPITRGNVAQLAAKAIGFGQSFATSPFADTQDGYVIALAEAGILEGMKEHDEMVFHPERSLTRAEVSTIVWRLRNAVALHKTQTLTYNGRILEIAPGVPLNTYSADGFSGSGDTMDYSEPGVTVLRGVDVSRYQGTVDWDALWNAGARFAILRVGGRYQQSGEIYDDKLFEEYYAGAKAVGMRIGVYFYSQAINTNEAVEEADYVLAKLNGKELDGPVVFDWETAESANARTSGLPVATVCDCAVAYCERVKEAGYAPMVYMNAYDGYLKYDVSRLKGYDIWYAGQYNGAYPKFIYDFKIWQYTDTGRIDGIDGRADLDLWFFRDGA